MSLRPDKSLRWDVALAFLIGVAAAGWVIVKGVNRTRMAAARARDT